MDVRGFHGCFGLLVKDLRGILEGFDYFYVPALEYLGLLWDHLSCVHGEMKEPLPKL